MWAWNETAILMLITLRPRMRKLHFLQKQKHYHSVPPGNLKEIKNGINSSSGNPLFKNHMLSSLLHENCSWNTSLMLLVSYSCFIPIWLRDRGQPSGKGINEVQQELDRKDEGERAWLLSCCGRASCMKQVSRPPRSGDRADRGGS